MRSTSNKNSVKIALEVISGDKVLWSGSVFVVMLIGLKIGIAIRIEKGKMNRKSPS